MVMEEAFNALSLTDLCVDITDEVDELCSKLDPKTIVKSPFFDLFQGTHSLEINNDKLDTFLIPLSESNFDCNIAYGNDEIERLKFITSICDRLLRLIICWLNEYQTLPTTILSCRYVEFVLNATNKKVNQFKTGDKLYDDVLYSFVLGLSSFAFFVKTLLIKGVVYEEEDLNFNFMGLNGFEYLPNVETVLKLIDQNVDWLCQQSFKNNLYCLRLIKLLQMIKNITKIQNILNKHSSETDYLDDIITLTCSIIDDPNELKFEVPESSFSMSIQKKSSNQYPPKNLVVPGTKLFEGFITMANDLKLILRISEVETACEAYQFASFFNKFTQRHVLARGLFPLFLMRDDQTILGKYSFSDFLYSHFMEISLFGTIAQEQYENDDNLYTMLTPAMQECLTVIMEFYQNCSQNTARYRQGYNRQLLLWDSAQAQLETFEMKLIDMGICDMAIDNNKEVPLLPFASWTFIMKVLSMIEFTLKGFDLEVYKTFEIFDQYYYTFYLCSTLMLCINKLETFYSGKIEDIQNMSKKYKKQKNKAKKELLKAEYEEKRDTDMPQLRSNKQFLKYLNCLCQMYKSLSLLQIFQFAVLKSVNLVDNKPIMNKKFINDKLIHDLRFKTFSSIGVPELPSMETFDSTLHGFLIQKEYPSEDFNLGLNRIDMLFKIEIGKANNCINTIIRSIKSGDKNGEILSATRLVKDESLDFFNRHLQSVADLEKNFEANNIIIKDKSTSEDKLIKKHAVILEVDKDTSRFYPKIKIIDKQRH